MNQLVHILHLEDDPVDAELIASTLARAEMDCQVDRVQTREEFEAALNRAKYDIILADFKLPTFDGLLALQMTKDLHLDVPFIFVSGTMGEDAAIEALTKGATDYVLKFKLIKLIPAIKRSLEESEHRHARKQVEEALGKSEELYRKLIAAIPDMIVRTDIDGNILFINEVKFTSLHSFTRQDLLGMNIFSFISAEDRERATFNKNLMFEKFLGPKEYKLVFDAGKELKCEVNGAVLRNTDNSPYGMVYVIRDITERKHAEDELRKLSRAVEQSPVSIVITDINGNIEYVNSKFTEVSGYSRSEVMGQNTRILKSGEMPPETYVNLWQTITSGKEWYGEFHNKKKNGDLHWELASISPIFDANGIIDHFLAVKEDITERKQTEKDLIKAKEKAEENDRLKSFFLANMSHEIRTPLNSIIGFSELLLDPDFGPEQHAHFAKVIIDNGNNLLAVISDIMDISKIEAGQVRIVSKNIQVKQLVSSLFDGFLFKARSKKIELRLDPANPTEEVVIQSDGERLKQILNNLIGNAIKFTNIGFVEIGFKIKSNFVQFHVKDTGIGIKPEFHNQIFERFRQIESSYTRKYGGNGLGLAISKSLVELLGGKIWLESEPGKGSTFYFTIPK